MKHVSNNLYRGARPSSTYLFRKSICLQSGSYTMLHDDLLEKKQSWGENIKPIFCSDIFPPKDWQVYLFLNLVQSTTDSVYVHCLHGKDRTGFMCAVWRMRKDGWSYEMARDEMISEGFHMWPYFWWLWKLKRWSNDEQ